MDATSETTAVERQIAIAAKPETVWEFLVDPEKATRWMGLGASFDVRPGGLYRVEVLSGNTARGEFVEIDPPHRLVITWGWEAGSPILPGASTLEFELTPQSDGTLLRLSHRDLPDLEAATRHGHGWDHYLARLAEAATGGDPGTDPWIEGQID
jgi:uncharacterized protein YndB with AHSA1/START domain